MSRRLLFVVRAKLGDTLVSFATVQAWRDRHPEDEITFFTRADYARLLAGEPGIRVVGFERRLTMFARALAWRLSRPAFDALLVLWGFGRPIERLARLVRARRKLFVDGRFPDAFDAWPPPATFDTFESRAAPAWRVARLLDAELPLPQRLGLARLRAERVPAALAAHAAVALVPLADEPRRSLDAPMLADLLAWARRQWAERPLWVIVNPRDSGAETLRRQPLPAGAQWRTFSSLDELLALYRQLGAWAGTDTGLYHLAAAMGIPATVFFGPTEPQKVVLPGQPAAATRRLAALGNRHCDATRCQDPLCLRAVLAHGAGRALPAPPDASALLPDCLLRPLAAEDFNRFRHHENPDPQA